MACEHEFTFEELTPIIDGFAVSGMPLFGVATLTDEGNDSGDFYVSEIVLEGGYRLRRTGSDHFKKTLFKHIEDIITDPAHRIGRVAIGEFSDALAASREPDPDYLRDLKRDEQLMELA